LDTRIGPRLGVGERVVKDGRIRSFGGFFFIWTRLNDFMDHRDNRLIF